ncbi:MAG: hypothetical protein ACHQQR_00795 [Gemmatimonadales bacterium]
MRRGVITIGSMANYRRAERIRRRDQGIFGIGDTVVVPGDPATDALNAAAQDAAMQARVQQQAAADAVAHQVALTDAAKIQQAQQNAQASITAGVTALQKNIGKAALVGGLSVIAFLTVSHFFKL